MSNVAYILGTVEYLIFEVEVDSPGETFVSSEWEAEAALCPVSEPFDPAAATWTDATIETVGGRHYVKVLAGTGGIAVQAKTYKGFVRLTKTSGGTEIPVIPASGTITFGRG